ncbi:MAG TPA: acyl-CoA thioesterase II [Sporichthya sp.]|nr:acyl-CoA thioesterase II [Sporichthya sp.]
MPRSTGELVDLFILETIEEGLYRGKQPESAMQRVFGGQVLGQALLAASLTVDPKRLVHSFHAYFLLAGDPAVPIVYDVDTLRDGRSFSARRVAARQHGKHIFYLTASYQGDEPGVSHQDVMPGDVPPPEECPPLADSLAGVMRSDVAAAMASEFGALDFRFAGSSGPGGRIQDAAHPAVARVWMRAGASYGQSSGDQVADQNVPEGEMLHRCLLAYMSDLSLLHASLVPHHAARPEDIVRASLDHAMWFHRPFRADGWLLYDQVSPSASGARGLSFGRIYQEGVLVASAVQEGLIRHA